MKFVNYEASAMPQKVHIIWEKVVESDGHNEAPDQNDEGFWPSQDSEAAGYCGEHTDEEFEQLLEDAQQRFNDWENGVWEYVGVRAKATVYIPIGGNSFHIMEMQSAGLWGIESDAGDYLDDVYQEEKDGLILELQTLATAINDKDIIEKD